MRLIVILVLVFFAAAGVVVGALNAGLVDYDFAFARLQLPKGAALLAALVLGWLLGGLTAWLGVGMRQRRLQRRRRKEAGKTPAGA
ncbi:MAG TPA: lipopolysaccharide assembly protein LapA domain-containing protein [Rhodanobacter sp.]